MQSKTPFDYLVSVTGDCSSNNSGIISILLTGGTPPYTIEWVDPDLGTDVTQIGDSTRSGLGAGTYGLRVNDSTLPTNGEFYINIPVSNYICVNIDSVSSTTCSIDNGSVTASTTSNYSSTNFYLYNINDDYITSGVTNLNDIIFEGLSADTYYIIAEDLGGCSGTSSNFIVESSTTFDYGLYIVPDASCNGSASGKIYVTGQTGNAPYTYNWSNGQTGNTVTGLTQGVYSVEVINSLGCSLTKTAIIEKVDPIGFGNFVPVSPSCFTNDGSITLTITGGTAPYYYSASTGNFEISYSKDFTISNLSPGNYNFRITDAGLCVLEVGTTLIAPSGITSVDIVTENSYCAIDGGSVTISVVDGQAPYTYTIINQTGGTESYETILSNHTFSDLTSGDYTVVIQDSNGCGTTQEITILTQATFDVDVEITGTTCNANNGVVRVEKSSGGQPPFSYILDDSESFIDVFTSAVTFNNLTTGSHNVKIYDSTGCTQNVQFFVPSSGKLTYTLQSTSCGSGDEGTITAFISDGEPPFNFYWSDNVSGNPQDITVTGLTADTYSLTIVDSNNCSLTRTIDITCGRRLASFQIYVMGEDDFDVETQTKFGISQMYSDGFFDISSGNTNCSINNATFKAKVSVNPSGFTGDTAFYTSTSILDYPTDQLWFTTLTNLLNTVDGISNIIIDETNNELKIETDEVSGVLNGQEILVELIIEYDITCDQ